MVWQWLKMFQLYFFTFMCKNISEIFQTTFCGYSIVLWPHIHLKCLSKLVLIHKSYNYPILNWFQFNCFHFVIKILYDIFNLFKPNPFWLYYENVGLITWACIKDMKHFNIISFQPYSHFFYLISSIAFLAFVGLNRGQSPWCHVNQFLLSLIWNSLLSTNG